MTRMYSQMSQLGQHNAELVHKNIEANTKMVDLGARQQALEEGLARATGERDVQRALAEQKAREAEAQAVELQRLPTALEEKAREAEAQNAELRRLRTVLEQQETELLHKEVTVVTLTGTLREKGEALEEKEVALQNVGTVLKEKEDSLSSLEEAARVQRKEAQKSMTGKYLRVFVGLFLFVAYVDFLCSELRQKVADESAAKEAVHTALTAAEVEFAELEQIAVSVCQELEGEGAVSGSSVISRL
jgi:hypothetical protein